MLSTHFCWTFSFGKNTRSIQFFVKDMAYIMVEFLFSNEQLELRARVKLLHGNSARCRVTGVSIGEMLGKISYLPLASEPALAPSTRVAVREKVVITFSICLQVSTQLFYLQKSLTSKLPSSKHKYRHQKLDTPSSYTTSNRT